MTSKLLTLVALSTSVLAVSACTTKAYPPPAPGKYETTKKMTNSDGTDVRVNKTTYVSKDSNGNTKASTQTKTTTDPEGLMNKSTSTTNTTKKY